MEGLIKLRCHATARTGRRCRVTKPGWLYDRESEDPLWFCKRHAPICPHCDFASQGLCLFPLETIIRRDDADSEVVGRKLICRGFCFCEWDSDLNLIDASEHCLVWGTGPRPGTVGNLIFNQSDDYKAAFKEAYGGALLAIGSKPSTRKYRVAING